MNENRMSPSGVNTSGLDSLLKMGSLNNAAGALTQGAQSVIEAELKAQAFQLEAASDFAKTSAVIVNSQLVDVQDQADSQCEGDSAGAWGEIGGGVIGAVTGFSGFGAGLKGMGSDSDELTELNGFEKSLDKVGDSDLTLQGSNATVPKSLEDEITDQLSGIQELEANKIPAEEAELTRANATLQQKESGLQQQIEKLNKEVELSQELFNASEERIEGLRLQVGALRNESTILDAKREALSASILDIEQRQGALGRGSPDFLALSREKESLNKELGRVGRKLDSNQAALRDKDTEVGQESVQRDSILASLNSAKQSRAQIQAELDGLRDDSARLGGLLSASKQSVADLKAAKEKLEKQKELFDKLTKPVMGDNGKLDLDLSGLSKYDEETREAVLNRLGSGQKKLLKTSFEKAQAKAKEASDAAKHQKGAHLSTLLQVVTQVAPSIGQGAGTQAGVAAHMTATVDGAEAQVEGTVSGQFEQASSSIGSQAASNLQTALQVAASIRG